MQWKSLDKVEGWETHQIFPLDERVRAEKQTYPARVDGANVDLGRLHARPRRLDRHPSEPDVVPRDVRDHAGFFAAVPVQPRTPA